jgi:CRISPR-associated protein Cas2
MDRRRFLVCYDICNPKRLRQVEKTVKSYGTRIQFSVFECLLDGIRLAQLRQKLSDVINSEYDQVMFVSLGPEAGTSNFRIETVGQPYESRSRVTIL